MCLKNLDIFRSGKIFYKNARPQKELIYVLVSLTRGSWRVYKQNYQHKMHIEINKEITSDIALCFKQNLFCLVTILVLLFLSAVELRQNANNK